MLYRSSMNLFSIVLAVWRVCIDLIHPTLTPTQNGVNVQWLAEEKE